MGVRLRCLRHDGEVLLTKTIAILGAMTTGWLLEIVNLGWRRSYEEGREEFLQSTAVRKH